MSQQVVCERLWSGLSEKAIEITENELKGVDTSLRDFYEETIREAAKQTGVDETKIRDWCEKLITATGTRSIVHQEQQSTAGLPNGVVKILADKYLIRGESRSGALWY